MSMKISADTRLSTILRHHRDAVEVISGISTHFRKLHNPILRKWMAPRVNLAQAAKIGGCSLNDFKKALEPLGFEFEMNQPTSSSEKMEPIPEWYKQLNRESIALYDVREELSQGKDPLSNILLQLEVLPVGQTLCIINSFKPEPLIALLEKNNRGVCYTEAIHPFEFHTYIRKPETASKTTTVHLQYNMVKGDIFQSALMAVPAHKLITLDVRHLEMPLPMQQILAAVQNMQREEVLYVLHKRIPVHLLEAMDTTPLIVMIVQHSETDVQLLIQHK